MSSALYEARPTTYGARRFASRLEATWAAFFDHVAIQWIHEPFRVQLDNGVQYLPDFYLPEIATWFEVKGWLIPEALAKPEALFRKLSATEQKVAIGGPDGRIMVPHLSSHGIRFEGGAMRCGHCASVWFDSVHSPNAARCYHCGESDGARQSVSALNAAFQGGLVPGWFSNFNPVEVRMNFLDTTRALST